jgi:hypothetical protein
VKRTTRGPDTSVREKLEENRVSSEKAKVTPVRDPAARQQFREKVEPKVMLMRTGPAGRSGGRLVSVYWEGILITIPESTLDFMLDNGFWVPVSDD